MDRVYDKDAHIEEMGIVIDSLTREIIFLRKRKQARNDEAARKWRGQAIYFRNKCRRLEEEIKNGGKNGICDSG